MLFITNRASTSTKPQTFESGQVVNTFGNLELVKNNKWSTVNKQLVKIAQISQDNELLKSNEKFMFDTLKEQCLIAGDRLFEIGKGICLKLIKEMDNNDENGVNFFDDLSNPNESSPNEVHCVGRICCENDEKLGLGSTILMGTDDATVRTVRLNFQKLNSLGIFPGQTVTVQGINPRGEIMFASNIFTERELTYADPPELIEPLNVVLAAGPFTLSNDLTYGPLHELMGYCKQNEPNVLILMGPFLDADHSLIVDGVLAETFDAFFEKMIVGIMEAVG